MKTIIVRDLMTIVLGVQGENEATQVRWPGIVPKYKAAFGDGVYTLVVMRPKDTGTYPVAVSIDGDDLVWVVSGADTAQAGSGKCELIYTVNDVIAKSQTWATRVSSSISGDAPGEPPENPAKAWFLAMQAQIGDLSKLATKAKDNLVAAINEAARTGSGGAGSISMRSADGYIQYSTDDGASWENLIAIADLKGEPGEDGAPGADGITPHIGETGNWYLGDVDTGRPSRGAPGAKGDPGKDGAGLDITSATVGQIAKISAVDDNGVPTEWEPVDMPSGGDGETWEKIGVVEFSSDTSLYIVANFATWRKVKIIMNRNTYVSGLSKNVWCKFYKGKSEYATIGYMTAEYGYVHWEVSAEVNDLFAASFRQTSNNRNVSAYISSTGIYLLNNVSPDELNIGILFIDTSVIQAGDKITVLGVRR